MRTRPGSSASTSVASSLLDQRRPKVAADEPSRMPWPVRASAVSGAAWSRQYPMPRPIPRTGATEGILEAPSATAGVASALRPVRHPCCAGRRFRRRSESERFGLVLDAPNCRDGRRGRQPAAAPNTSRTRCPSKTRRDPGRPASATASGDQAATSDSSSDVRYTGSPSRGNSREVRCGEPPGRGPRRRPTVRCRRCSDLCQMSPPRQGRPTREGRNNSRPSSGRKSRSSGRVAAGAVLDRRVVLGVC